MSGDRVIRALLRLYPAAFRERYGADMLAFHRDRVQSGGGVRMWVRIVVDHITSAHSEWIRAARCSPICYSTCVMPGGRIVGPHDVGRIEHVPQFLTGQAVRVKCIQLST